MIPFHRLLGYRFRALWNSSLGGQARHRRLNWGLLLLAVPWSLFFFGGVGYRIGVTARSAPNGPLVMEWVVTGILAAEFLLMLIGEMGGFANLLFFSGQGEWLRRAPIPGRRFLAYQIVEGGLVMAAVPTLFLFAIYVCVLSGYRPGIESVVVGTLGFALIRILPLGVSLVGVWILVPRTDRETFRWLDAVLGILFGFLMLALWRVNIQPDALPRLMQGALLPQLPTYLVALFPPAAVGRISAALISGGPFHAEAWVLVTTQTALLVGLPLALAARMIDEGRFPEPASGGVRARSLWVGPSGPLFALIRKDVLVFLREGRLGLRLLSSALITAAVLWFVLGASPAGAEAPALVLIFILASEAGTLVLPAEGRAVVWPAGAPLPARRFVLAKLLAALLFTGTVTSAFLFLMGIVMRWPLVMWVEMAVLGPLVALFGASLGLFLAARWGRFDWDDPRRMLQPAAQLFHAALMVMGFVLAATAAALSELTEGLFQLGALAAMAGLCLVLSGIGIADAVRTLSRKEWLL